MKNENEVIINSVNNVANASDLIKQFKAEPEPVFFWQGIEDVSFGYVFGPSKAGKTIFCENMAISLATGKDMFFGKKMIGEPKKVFLASLEENHRNRTNRLIKQISVLDKIETDLLDENMIFASKGFPRFIYSKEQWKSFENKVLEIKPDIVIVDSLTRIVNDDITNRDRLKVVLQRLRNFAYDNKLCFILIHHSIKMDGKPITMDSMAGSSVLSQEADFSIGLNSVELTKERYFKEVFYRYKESDEMVTPYKIDDNSTWLAPMKETYEAKILTRTQSQDASNYSLIVDYLEKKAEGEISNIDSNSTSISVKVAELKQEFVTNGTMPSRTFDYTLKKLKKKNVLTQSGSSGNYIYKL